jgi:hypothetical protein
MWNVKAKLIPVNNMDNYTTSKSFNQYLSKIQGKHEIKKMQTFLGTAHMLWKVLM